MTFTYSDADLKGINESTLAVYYWDTATSQWVKLGGTVDLTNNKITATTSHFTQFAVLGEKTAGMLVKLACAAGAKIDDPCKAVYYVGNNSKRYVFPNDRTYNTWYSDFSQVKTISAAELATYQIGGNVTYRPGIRMLKIQTDPKVYAIAEGGTLRWVKTEAVAKALYGDNWNQKIDDISAAFFTDYKTGADIATAAEYAKDSATTASPDINTDKGL